MKNHRRAAMTVVAALAALPLMASPGNAAPASGDASRFTYSPGWNGSNTERWSPIVGGTATLKITVNTGGGTVALRGMRDPTNHTVSVSVDGGPTVNANQNGGNQPDYRFWSSSQLSPGHHTIVVTVVTADGSIMGADLSNGVFGHATITPPSGSPSPSAGNLEVLARTGTWGTPYHPNEIVSSTADSTVTVTADIAAGGGTLSIRGVKGPSLGIANFSVDGGANQRVDLYATGYAHEQRLFTTPTLPAGRHTVRLTVTGTKRAASSHADVSLVGANTSNGTLVGGNIAPSGVPSTLRWSDEFNGASLDLSRWSNMDGRSMNNVTARASNISVTGGNLVLRRSDANTGAFVSSASIDGAGSNARTLAVGEYVEARIQFPANIANWDAWWTAGPNWPAAGEIDIAEVLSGELTVNYHGNQSTNYGAPPGDWDGAFHIYSVHRKAGSADVYWDGRLVKSFPTYDNGQGQSLLLNVGGGPATGAGSEMKVDYVRLYG